MKKNSILIDSGFGSYLKGEKPKAIANEFLYYNPSILLWVDEMYCDVLPLMRILRYKNRVFATVEAVLSKKGLAIARPFYVGVTVPEPCNILC
jgi:hypothetical protein